MELQVQDDSKISDSLYCGLAYTNSRCESRSGGQKLYGLFRSVVLLTVEMAILLLLLLRKGKCLLVSLRGLVNSLSLLSWIYSWSLSDLIVFYFL